jgi:Co/Zn/Cd efflux system component
MDQCCPQSSDLARDARRRCVLWYVLAINAIMFVVEFGAGLLAGSVALQADSLDMLGDALVYGFSLAVVGRAVLWQSRAALLKGSIMLLFGLGVLGQVVLKILAGVPPSPEIVSATGALALAANGACVALLFRYRADDINMHSTWVCSRNDIIANVSVILSAAGVVVFASIWPDVLVSLGIVALFLHSATKVLAAAAAEMRADSKPPPGALCPNGLCPASACQCPAA